MFGSVPPASRLGGEQPAGCYLGAAQVDPLAADHRVLQCACQYGDVAAQYGGG